MKSIGIDISRSGLTLVEIAADRNGYEIKSGVHLPYSEQSDSDWELEVLQNLKDLGQKYDFENATVCTGLSLTQANTRNLEFPFSKRTNIVKSLPFELEDELPIDAEDYVFDSKIISKSENSSTVLAFAASKDLVEQKLEFFNKVQIDPDIISLETIAFSNLFENIQKPHFLSSSPEESAESLQLKIFIRLHNTIAGYFMNDQLIAARVLEPSETQVIHAIMAKMSTPYDSAKDFIKPNSGLSGHANIEQDKVASLTREFNQRMIQELRLMRIELQDRFQTELTHIEFYGALSQSEGFSEFFQSQLDVSCSSHPIEGHIFSSAQSDSIRDIIEVAPIAVGLALEATKKAALPAINFRQQEFAKKNQFLAKTWNKWGYTITLLLILYVFWIGYGIARQSIAQNLDNLAYDELSAKAQSIANLKKKDATPKKIRKYIKTQSSNYKKQKLFSSIGKINPGSHILQRISESFPNNQRNKYDIRKLSVQDGVLKIEGLAEKGKTVNKLKAKLMNFSKDNKVSTAVPSIKGRGQRFAFSLKLKD